jgi:4-amino-4-deoxy-L-arabinose transferase-like glycosyltransferase
LSNHRNQADTRANTVAAEPNGKRYALVLLAAVFIAVWFSNLEYRKLTRPDEGRYAEIAREMAVTGGDWITPRLNGIKYFEKPPLQYWATAAAYRLFGEHQWTARLWPAATGLGAVLLVFFAGRRLFGPAAGLSAAIVLASSVAHVGLGHFNSLDMGLAFFMTGTLAAFLLGQQPSAGAAEKRNWCLVAWACAALAVLSKGLVGIVLPGAVLAVYVALQRDFGLLRGLQWGTGIALFLGITAPWFVLVQLANPEFVGFFFVHEHFERFLAKSDLHVRPWWFFFPILAVGMLPWLTLLPEALVQGWRIRRLPEAFHPARFLLVWTVVIFAFFSASGSKLPPYVLPVFPALALLAGLVLSEIGTRRLVWHTVPVLAGGIAIAAFSLNVVLMARENVPAALSEAYAPWIAAAGLALVIGGGYALHCCRLGKRAAAVLGIGVGGLIAAQLVVTGHDTLSPAHSAYHIVRDTRPYLAETTPFYSVRTYDQTLPFYIKRTVTLVAFQGELAYGLEQEPQLSIPDIPSFERAWRNEAGALAIMEPRTYAELEEKRLPMQIVARDLRRIVVRSPGAAP